MVRKKDIEKMGIITDRAFSCFLICRVFLYYYFGWPTVVLSGLDGKNRLECVNSTPQLWGEDACAMIRRRRELFLWSRDGFRPGTSIWLIIAFAEGSPFFLHFSSIAFLHDIEWLMCSDNSSSTEHLAGIQNEISKW